MVIQAVLVDSLRKSYGSVQALRGVSFGIRYGELVGYLGPNGAGKTTTIKIIAGILKPDSGDVQVDGVSILQDPIKVKSMISYVPEEGGLFGHLTVYEHIKLVAALRGLGDAGVMKGLEIAESFGLTEYLNRRISTLSKGNRQKLLLAGAFMVDAKVYLLDEPLVGLDAPSAMVVKEMLRDFVKNGKAVLFSSHILETVERLCDRVVLIDRGEIIATGDMASIKEIGTLEDFFSRMIEIKN